MKKRIICCLLILCLVFSLLPATAFAAEEGLLDDFSVVGVNPLYEDIITESDLIKSRQPLLNADNTVDDPYYYDAFSAGELIRDDLVARDTTIVVNAYCESSDDTYQEDAEALVYDILGYAMMHTGSPSEGDYLLWHYQGFEADILDAALEEGYLFLTISYTMYYLTTAEQEEKVTHAIADLLTELNVYNESAYDKLKAIYDFICSEITYDNEHDNSYLLKHTAYAALINRTAVCQGYATLLYRLALSLDIDCRLIAGTSKGVNHGWNIVQLDALYYYLDATWDAGESVYQNFLVGSNNFIDHTPFSEYLTAEFKGMYPTSFQDYVKEHDHVFTSEVVPPSCTLNGYTVFTCECGYHYFEDYISATGGHSYMDGVCEKCGEEDPDRQPPIELFKIDSANMTLGNNLAMNFYVDPDYMDADAEYYAEIIMTYSDNRNNVIVRIDDDDWGVDSSDGFYYFTLDMVAAKEMADIVYVTIFRDENVDVAVSEVWSDSVCSYAERAIKQEEGKASPDADKLALYVDLLNYGAEAQKYFVYNVNGLANRNLTAEQLDYGQKEVLMSNQSVRGTGYAGMDLVLKSNIILDFYFITIPEEHNDMYAIATYTNHYGVEKKIRVEGEDFAQDPSDGCWYVPVKGLVVADCMQLVTIQVYNADGTVVGNAVDSVESYVARIADASPLYVAIMKFAVSAYNSFH